MYRDYDGDGGAFGALGLPARNSAPAASSVYASTDDAGAGRVVIVAINKLRRAREAVVTVEKARTGWRTAAVYTLTDAAPGPRRGDDIPLAGAATLRYTMPPMSVSTVVLTR
jgi:hypothetical protein